MFRMRLSNLKVRVKFPYPIFFILYVYLPNLIALITKKLIKAPCKFVDVFTIFCNLIIKLHKGESVYDWYTHHPFSNVDQKSTGDVACDSYHLYKEDVKLLKDIGFNHYRFSLSWTRILPTGFADRVSKDGIKYYNDLLDELHSKGIKPLVTLYHWDHPQVLEEMGGWTNKLMIEWFMDYARVVFKELGPKIKSFITINEPYVLCSYRYGKALHAPGRNLYGYGEYLCGHNVLKAHASVYHMYHNEFSSEGGEIGITNACFYFFTVPPDNDLDQEVYEFTCGWFSHPIFSKEGDYPLIMKRIINETSIREGKSRSRLPTFDKKWIDYIKGTSDFYGVNHYTAYNIKRGEQNEPFFPYYINAVYSQDSKWPKAESSWLSVVPEGFRQLLKKIKTEYDNPPVYITENGFSDHGQLIDTQRVDYLVLYLAAMLQAIHEDSCNIKMYTVWSLLDSFEWLSGYCDHFGIVSVDFNDPSRKRTAKYSANWFKDLLIKRRLQLIYNNTLDFHP